MALKKKREEKEHHLDVSRISDDESELSPNVYKMIGKVEKKPLSLLRESHG